MTQTCLPALALAAFVLLLPATPAHAAESYDNCAGTISSLPTVITTQGVWCLKGDLATAISSGSAITVNAPNVTIDCNGFKLGGLAAGLGTGTTGISGSTRDNITVRGCIVRGFLVGISLDSAYGGHRVEDNLVDSSTGVGIRVRGNGSIVRGNQVLYTGGSTNVGSVTGTGIFASGAVQVLDNTIHDVSGTLSKPARVFGVYYREAEGGLIAGNAISRVFLNGPGLEELIVVVLSSAVVIRDNDLSGMGTGWETGVSCLESTNGARGNTFLQIAIAHGGCADLGGNVSN